MKERKVINSYFGTLLESSIVDQGSDTLVVLLPGIEYPLDKPLMYYSKKLVQELGYDVLPIEYGFQVARKKFNIDEELKYVITESIEILNASISSRKYENVVIIGKSLGTVVQTVLCDELKECKVMDIYLTPINRALNLGIKENSLVITGTNDSLISSENLEKIMMVKGAEVVKIDGADHSLNIKDDIIKASEYNSGVFLNSRINI